MEFTAASKSARSWFPDRPFSDRKLPFRREIK